MRSLISRLTMLAGVACLLAGLLFSAERTVDPSWLHRFVPDLKEQPAGVTTPTCHYKAIFGAGDSEARVLKGVARYGEMTVDPGGQSAPVTYPGEEQVFVILDGTGVLLYGDQEVPVRKNDFGYLPPGIRHGIRNPSASPCRLMLMGFKVPEGAGFPPQPKPLVANIDDIQKQTVGGHPPSVLYQLMMGDTGSTRDRIAAGHVLTSLYVMEFAPGGTNFPHHHETDEEIYLVLDGEGEMVAGGGMNGIEGRHPARAGDAYAFRLNCTVGFYSSAKPGTKARILAVRSLFPFPHQK